MITKINVLLTLIKNQIKKNILNKKGQADSGITAKTSNLIIIILVIFIILGILFVAWDKGFVVLIKKMFG
ncbi:hypothetical protein K9L67_03675 [Candidatus Woesearchaeota archaeon]|nr:hypothetical protein [Candidatus Woesearchaeota archaeon]MCF7901301.1 hypothetical protein [Candidatus Woesearchaeota archaeon]MCF8013793.1 hypothetical protein [Candidatus Woesearchaeota archaeon]